MSVGPSGGGSGSTVVVDTPTGAINGVNTVFIFSATPICVFFQGVVQQAGLDYTVSSSTVTFAVPPNAGVVQGLIAA